MKNYFKNDLLDVVDSFLSPLNVMMKTDIIEKEDAFVFKIDLPAVKKEEVKIQLSDGMLLVDAEIKSEKVDEQAKYVCRERNRGTFSRSFRVGKGVSNKDISAKLADGVLTITVLKQKPVEPETGFIDIE